MTSSSLSKSLSMDLQIIIIIIMEMSSILSIQFIFQFSFLSPLHSTIERVHIRHYIGWSLTMTVKIHRTCVSPLYLSQEPQDFQPPLPHPIGSLFLTKMVILWFATPFYGWKRYHFGSHTPLHNISCINFELKICSRDKLHSLTRPQYDFYYT